MTAVRRKTFKFNTFWKICVTSFITLLIIFYFRVLMHYLRGPKTIFVVAQSGPGRLGNQLFQFVSVIGIYENRRAHNSYNDKVVFCVHREHRFLELEAIFKGPFPICPEEIPQPKHLPEHGYGIFTEYDETQFCYASACSFTFGPYLQSYKYFYLAGKSVRSALTFRNGEIIKQASEIVHQARTNPTTAVVGVHVRRTDILHVDYLQAASVDYLKRAMQHFISEFGSNVRFLIVSDDVEWCRSQEIFSTSSFVENGNDMLDLTVLSRCDHMILTVGTFGWWGAWLGMAEDVTYNPKAIILDHPMNKGQIQLDDYYPSIWRGI